MMVLEWNSSVKCTANSRIDYGDTKADNRMKPLAILLAFLVLSTQAAVGDEVPQSVEQLWADFDPQRDPLETEVIREVRDQDLVIRHVRFAVGTFKGHTARMTAIYGFPKSALNSKGVRPTRLPAVMHIHGGGQRAYLHEVKLLAQRGYAALSVNWGGDGDGTPPFNSVEGAEPGDPNTEWGPVDPTQLNASAYSSVLPGPKQLIEDREDPRNCNWYLLTLACRRGLTFLEQQPEVDPERLGVHGYSMGGNLTMYVAGTDRRVKAAVPAVGGAGWRWQAHRVMGGEVKLDHARGDVDLFRRTMSFESYAPLIHCPVLHRSATNDFHGWIDDVYRTNALIPNQPLGYSWTVHVNHRLSPEVAVTMPLWFDHYLKGGPALPDTPATQLELKTERHVPRLLVTPDSRSMPVARVEVYYSVDPDPRARFWRSAEAQPSGAGWKAELPLHSLEFPLFTFANVYHTLPRPESLAAIPGNSQPIHEVCISSEFHTVAPNDLSAAGVQPTWLPTPVIDDFSHGMRDWYTLNGDHPTLVQHWTRKLADPAFRGPKDAKLKLTLKMPQTNWLSFVILENEWRSYRGPRKTFVCDRKILGSDQLQVIEFQPADFVSNKAKLSSWDHVDQWGLCAHFSDRGLPARQPSWSGQPPTWVRLEWVSLGPAR